MFLFSSCFPLRQCSQETKSAPAPGGLLVVANQKEHTLLVVDPENRRELSKISVGVNGHEVIVSKDGHFGLCSDLRQLRRRTTRDGWQHHRCHRPAGAQTRRHYRSWQAASPHCAEFGPDGLLYVTAETGKRRRRHRSFNTQSPRGKFPPASRNPTCW